MSTDVESLIDLKFTLEKEISLYNETYNKINNNCIYSGGSIEYNLYNKYRTNMNMAGSEYINKQKELLKKVTDMLLQSCDHDWVDDVIEDGYSERKVCYCKHCFIYKSGKR